MVPKLFSLTFATIGFALVCTVVARTQEAPAPQPSPTQDLKEAAQRQEEAADPFASLIFQYDTSFNYGYYREMQQKLEIQGVVLSDVGAEHRLLTRTVASFYAFSPPGPGVGSQVGFGDLNPQFFYMPKMGSNVQIGYGPAFIFPTGTSQYLGLGKWAVGPDAAILAIRKNIKYGVLVENVWSVAGDPARPNYSEASLDGFYSWTLAHGDSVGVKTDTTALWSALDSNKWTVPFGPSFGHIVKFDEDHYGQLGLAFFWNVVRPRLGSTWTARLQLVILQR